ncbi:MAG: carboxypeptidase regulatory-like domain-containing protein [Cytophagaceae bacterium]|nr:carboxypeptidase regulatory-like domain-containing protein [Gemmatimonadaceae bacterium]
MRTTVSGTVYDSVGRRYLDSALVQLVRADRPGEGRTVSSDANGRFRFDGVAEGNWILGFLHPALDSLGIPSPLVQVRVREPQPIRANLTVPSPATLVKRVCGFPVDSGGLWYGYTRSAVDGRVLPEVTVQAQWSRIRVVRNAVTRDIPEVKGPSDEEGSFRHCYMPLDESVVARAWRDADSSGVVTFTMPAGGLLRRDIYVAPVEMVDRRVPADSGSVDSAIVVPLRTGDGRLVGRVTRPGGQPLKGARLRFLETGLEAVTSDNGYFGLDSLPLGSHTVDARALGYISALRPVDIIGGKTAIVDFVLDNRQVFLDTVKVVGRRVVDTPQHQDFLRRQRMGLGRFWDEDALEKSRALYVSDLFRMTPGVNVLPGGRLLFRALSGFQQYCMPTLFLDGMRMGGLEDLPLDALVNVQDIRAMEAYTRGSQVPAQFQTMTGCGSIVIWTGARTRRQFQ